MSKDFKFNIYISENTKNISFGENNSITLRPYTKKIKERCVECQMTSSKRELNASPLTVPENASRQQKQIYQEDEYEIT